MMGAQPKLKKCAVCNAPFAQARPLQRVCGYECALEDGRKAVATEKAKAARAERKAKKAALENLKTRKQHLQELQVIFNSWVRARDAGQPCISCGRHHQGQWHAGHYRSVGSAPELRFEPTNTHIQCQPCNTHLSGNLIAYRVNLIKKIGLERVEWLEGQHEPKKYTLEEIQRMKAFYRAEIRRLKQELGE